MKLTMRELRICTRLPAGVRQISVRVSLPSRKSRARSYESRSAIERMSGSSST